MLLSLSTQLSYFLAVPYEFNSDKVQQSDKLFRLQMKHCSYLKCSALKNDTNPTVRSDPVNVFRAKDESHCPVSVSPVLSQLKCT